MKEYKEIPTKFLIRICKEKIVWKTYSGAIIGINEISGKYKHRQLFSSSDTLIVSWTTNDSNVWYSIIWEILAYRITWISRRKLLSLLIVNERVSRDESSIVIIRVLWDMTEEWELWYPRDRIHFRKDKLPTIDRSRISKSTLSMNEYRTWVKKHDFAGLQNIYIDGGYFFVSYRPFLCLVDLRMMSS